MARMALRSGRVQRIVGVGWAPSTVLLHNIPKKFSMPDVLMQKLVGRVLLHQKHWFWFNTRARAKAWWCLLFIADASLSPAGPRQKPGASLSSRKRLSLSISCMLNVRASLKVCQQDNSSFIMFDGKKVPS
jgi:hypothetical protein